MRRSGPTHGRGGVGEASNPGGLTGERDTRGRSIIAGAQRSIKSGHATTSRGADCRERLESGRLRSTKVGESGGEAGGVRFCEDRRRRTRRAVPGRTTPMARWGDCTGRRRRSNQHHLRVACGHHAGGTGASQQQRRGHFLMASPPAITTSLLLTTTVAVVVLGARERLRPTLSPQPLPFLEPSRPRRSRSWSSRRWSSSS